MKKSMYNAYTCIISMSLPTNLLNYVSLKIPAENIGRPQQSITGRLLSPCEVNCILLMVKMIGQWIFSDMLNSSRQDRRGSV